MLPAVTSALVFTSAWGAAERWAEHDDCGSEMQTCWAWEYCPEGYTVTWKKWSWECFSRIDGCKFEDCVAPGECRVDLYEDHDAQGAQSVKFTPGSYNLVGGADIVSSVRLTGNNCKLEVFEFASGQGRSLVMTEPKLYNMKGGMDNAVKSMKLTVLASTARRLERRMTGAPNDLMMKLAAAALEEAAAKVETGDTSVLSEDESTEEPGKWTDIMAYPDLANGMLKVTEEQTVVETSDLQTKAVQQLAEAAKRLKAKTGAVDTDAQAKALEQLAEAAKKKAETGALDIADMTGDSDYKQAVAQLQGAMAEKEGSKLDEALAQLQSAKEAGIIGVGGAKANGGSKLEQAMAQLQGAMDAGTLGGDDTEEAAEKKPKSAFEWDSYDTDEADNRMDVL